MTASETAAHPRGRPKQPAGNGAAPGRRMQAIKLPSKSFPSLAEPGCARALERPPVWATIRDPSTARRRVMAGLYEEITSSTWQRRGRCGPTF